MHRTLLVTVALAACQGEAPPPAQDPTPPMLVRATQQDLAMELDAAAGRGSFGELRRRWQGQTLRWTVTRQAALCRSPEACFVAAFPVQRPAKHGWLPQLTFAPGQFAALEAACAARPQCEVTFEGLLDKLEVSAELPTNLRFSNVRLVTRTAAR